MVALHLWCRVTLIDADGAEMAHSTLEGPGAPDLLALDEVAHLALVAARAGGAVVLADVSPDMGDLLDLSGLGVEVQWQAESREEAFGVEREQKERHGGDLPA
jgi:hypothetical protein